MHKGRLHVSAWVLSATCGGQKHAPNENHILASLPPFLTVAKREQKDYLEESKDCQTSFLLRSLKMKVSFHSSFHDEIAIYEATFISISLCVCELLSTSFDTKTAQIYGRLWEHEEILSQLA